MQRLILAFLLLTAACGTSGSEPTASEPSMTTTSTTPNTTTTTTIPPPISIPIGDTTRFSPGSAYTGTLAVVDVEFRFEFQLEGWRVIDRGVGEGKFVTIGNTSTTPGAEILLMAWMPASDPDAVVSWFLDHPNLADATTRQGTEVSGLPATVVDIRVANAAPDSSSQCWGQIRVVADAARGTNTPGGVASQEIWACTWTRIWVIKVDGVSLTVAGMAHRDDVEIDPEMPWQIEDFEPLLDDFISAITFCIESTPCDG